MCYVLCTMECSGVMHSVLVLFYCITSFYVVAQRKSLSVKQYNIVLNDNRLICPHPFSFSKTLTKEYSQKRDKFDYLTMLKVKSLAGALSLLLLLTFIHLCDGKTGGETVVVFQDGKTAVKYPDSTDPTTTKTPSAFNAPSFVGGMINSKDFLAIISSGRVDASPQNDYTDVVVSTSHGDHKQWTAAEGFTNVLEKSDSVISWGDTTAVMNGNKIYVLITSMGNPNTVNDLRDPLMIVGTVTNRAKPNNDEVYINWGAASKVKENLPASVRDTDASKFMGGDGNGIVTTNGTIMFPIVTLKNNVDKVASTLYSIDEGKTWLIGGETETDSSDGSLVQWSDEKFLFVTASMRVAWKVFESDDFGITWRQSPILFGVWGNGGNYYGKTPGSVIAVPVESKNVLLFSFPQNKRNDVNFFDTLQLWLSDGQRIMCIGTISDEKKETNTGHSVLAYVGGNLYVTHQINPPGDFNEVTLYTGEKWKNVIGFTPLPDLFGKVKTAVREWRRLDDGYKSKGIPTDALVGFLGNTKTDDGKVWTDMYNCVNGIVTGGEKVDGGFKFNGAGESGAKWLVSSQGQNQVYKFTENQFTLAATVIIHNSNKDGYDFLIGAIGDSEKNEILIRLGYTKDMQLYLMHKSNEKIDTTVSVELGKEYHVAITVVNNAMSVYVGETEFTNTKITFSDDDSISYFFMGGTGVSLAATNDNLCTVKNVMLFSKALEKSEITQLTKVQYNDLMNEETTEANEEHVTQNSAANSEVTPSKDTDGQKLTPGTKTTIAQGNDKTISATESTSTTENIKSMPTKEPKEASVITPEISTNEGDHDKKINSALQGNGDAVLKKNSKSDNGAVLSLSALAWMYFICSLIVRMGF